MKTAVDEFYPLMRKETHSYADRFGNDSVCITPESNATLNGSLKRKHAMNDFADNTMHCLELCRERG